jgi:5-methylcytosine-specific restriction endonuclease McrA
MGLDTWARHSKHVTRTRRWRILRAAILERDNWRCTDCGAGGRLEVHHELRVKDHPEAAFDPDTLRALCPSCHTKITRIECGHSPSKKPGDGWAAAVADLMPRKADHNA